MTSSDPIPTFSFPNQASHCPSWSPPSVKPSEARKPCLRPTRTRSPRLFEAIKRVTRWLARRSSRTRCSDARRRDFTKNLQLCARRPDVKMLSSLDSATLLRELFGLGDDSRYDVTNRVPFRFRCARDHRPPSQVARADFFPFARATEDDGRPFFRSRLSPRRTPSNAP